jgi:hypothetical protein
MLGKTPYPGVQLLNFRGRCSGLHEVSYKDPRVPEVLVDEEYHCSRASPLRVMRRYICFDNISIGYIYITKACFGSKYSSFHLPDLVVDIEYFGYGCPIRKLTLGSTPGSTGSEVQTREAVSSFPGPPDRPRSR